MAIVKTKKADLMAKYKRVFELSLIAALALLIVAFKFFPDFKGKDVLSEGPQELFQVEQIEQTKQENRPPPPPKPPIPRERPGSPSCSWEPGGWSDWSCGSAGPR